jgi:anti-anti-sigma factor
MNFKSEIIDNNVIITINNNFVEGTVAAELKAKILTIVQPDIDSLIFDLTNVTIIDSSGLGALLLANRQFKDYNVPIYLVGVQNFVRNLLQITRIEEVFKFADSVSDVIQQSK